MDDPEASAIRRTAAGREGENGPDDHSGRPGLTTDAEDAHALIIGSGATPAGLASFRDTGPRESGVASHAELTAFQSCRRTCRQLVVAERTPFRLETGLVLGPYGCVEPARDVPAECASDSRALADALGRTSASSSGRVVHAFDQTHALSVRPERHVPARARPRRRARFVSRPRSSDSPARWPRSWSRSPGAGERRMKWTLSSPPTSP